MKAVGFIGLGNMGFNMAKNLLKSGCQLVVHDINAEPMQRLKVEIGAKTAKYPAEIAEECSEVVMMVNAKRGTLYISCSTLPPTFEIQTHEMLKQKQIEYIDAPVSGGVVGAENASLTFMVGGPEKSRERAEPILKNMGKNVINCGKIGSGQVAKLCNNMILGIQMLSVAEGINLGVRLGLDPAILSSVLNQSTGRCFSTEVNNPVPDVNPNAPSSRNYSGGFKCSLLAKDMKLAQEAAAESLTPIPLGSFTYQIYRYLTNSPKYRDLDFSAIYKFLCDEP
ncbi:unnamed protein product [Enterobius vermicularis]|uniref:3-hydroxyisobutyrate dehydrogenase n=1 Tax=Enterobius vermicularis TaxID=51028 RepID=A0A0N4VMA5_ENTVE|nr:unnamed protein product [Enterobius vermicularis]